MAKAIALLLVSLAALAGAGNAAASPISSLITFSATSDRSACDLIGPAEQSTVVFALGGRTVSNSLLDPLTDRPFTLTGTGRIAATTVVEAFDATLVIQGRDGDVAVRLRFPPGVSHSAICRPWLSRLIFSVSEGPYEATWPDGTRELGRYSFNYNRSSSGLTFGMYFEFDEIVAPPLPPPADPVTLRIPDDLVVEATGPSGARVTFEATATQGGRVLPAACAPASGSTFPLGTTTVACTAADASGTFSVTVRDTTPPVLAAPSDTTVGVLHPWVEFGSAGYVVRYTVSARDAVDGVVPVACDPSPGAEFEPGPTRVECTATDAAGNGVTASFVLTLPSIVAAWDELVRMIAAPGSIADAILGPHLREIRDNLVLLESDAGRPALMVVLRHQLATVQHLVRANPFLKAVFDGTVAAMLDKQRRLLVIATRGHIQRILRVLRPALDRCICSVHLDAIADAVASGAIDAAKTELARLEELIRQLRAAGSITPEEARELLVTTRLLGEYLDALDAFSA